MKPKHMLMGKYGVWKKIATVRQNEESTIRTNQFNAIPPILLDEAEEAGAFISVN